MLWEIPISMEVNLSGSTGKHLCSLPNHNNFPLGPGHFTLFPYMSGKKTDELTVAQMPA